ncbi:MAG TPA: RNA-binding cell elongation regulator Jag/EloR [Fimbriimonadaceae bacterium]|jgi:spoIIIJ-associated protein
MQTIETTGKSVKEATDAAAKKLGAPADQLKVTVLEQHKGLFGKATVRIKAELESAPASAAVEAPVVEEAKPAKAPKAPKAPKPEPVAEAPAAEEAAPAEAEETEEKGGREERVHADATEEDANRIHGLLESILKAGNLEVTAKVTGTSGRYVNVELDGRDVAFLVGKHGEVLNALQYVLNIISNQQLNNGIRATLDGNNYRHRREEALTKLATRIADEVKARGEEAVLDALPAFERRIVHKALSDYEGVATYSEGEEPTRRVVIAPAN